MTDFLRASSLRLIGLLACALLLGAAACTTQVSGGGSGGAGGTGGSTGTTQGQGGYMITAPCTNCGGLGTIAIRAAQLFGGGAGGGIGGTGTSGTGGGTFDPNMVYLELGNPSPTCQAPEPPTDCTKGDFEVSLGVPPALLVPGTLQLSNPALIASFSETAPGGGECMGGGGSFIQGTLEIVSVDAQQVTYTLSGTMAFDFGFGNVDGTYTAQRCP